MNNYLKTCFKVITLYFLIFIILGVITVINGGSFKEALSVLFYGIKYWIPLQVVMLLSIGIMGNKIKFNFEGIKIKNDKSTKSKILKFISHQKFKYYFQSYIMLYAIKIFALSLDRKLMLKDFMSFSILIAIAAWGFGDGFYYNTIHNLHPKSHEGLKRMYRNLFIMVVLFIFSSFLSYIFNFDLI